MPLKMKMKSAKAAITKASKSFSDWTTAQENPSNQMEYLVERWKHFENEMDSARNSKNGPLRWTPPPNRNPEEVMYQQTAPTHSMSQASSPAQPAAESASYAHTRTKIQDDRRMDQDIEKTAEEGKAELARYLRNHQREVENQQEVLKRRWDRMVFRSLPKLEKHSMINPQKLYTPSTKLKFDNAGKQSNTTVNSSNQPQPVLQETARRDITNQYDVNASYNQAAATSQPSTSSEPQRRVLTKLAAWSKSLEPPPPEPPKPVQPPNVLQVITQKAPAESVSTPSQESMADSEPYENTASSYEGNMSMSQQLPPLVEQLESSSTINEPKVPNSPYPAIPYAQRRHVPTPSAEPWMVSRGKRRLAKAPMSFESPLTSIERRMDLPQIQSPPYTISLSR